MAAKTGISRLHDALLRRGALISIVIGLAGLAWIALYPAACVSCGEAKVRGTHVSENALLIPFFRPQAHSRCGEEHTEWATLQWRRYVQETRSAHPTTRGNAAWLAAVFQTLDMDSGVQHLNHERANVFGVRRASTSAAGKENLVLAARIPLISSNATAQADLPVLPGAFQLLALAHYLLTVQWLSKDVTILLVGGQDGCTDAWNMMPQGDLSYCSSFQQHGTFGSDVRAWLNAYHAGELSSQARSGLIRAAVFVDVPGQYSLDHLALLTQGVNGQLPNMDLVNTVSQLTKWTLTDSPRDPLHTLRSRLAGSWFERNFGISYVSSAVELLRSSFRLAFGPAGAHSAFLAYHIDAFGISTVPRMSESTAHGIRTTALCPILEQTVRCMSNTDERLHVSYWFYLFPSPTTFISIGEYLYASCLIVLAVAVAAVTPSVAWKGIWAAATAVGVMMCSFGAETAAFLWLAPPAQLDSASWCLLWLASLLGTEYVLVTRAFAQRLLSESSAVPPTVATVDNVVLADQLVHGSPRQSDPLAQALARNVQQLLTAESRKRQSEEGLEWRCSFIVFMVLLTVLLAPIAVLVYPLALYMLLLLCPLIVLTQVALRCAPRRWVLYSCGCPLMLLTTPAGLFSVATLVMGDAATVLEWIVQQRAATVEVGSVALAATAVIYLPLHGLCCWMMWARMRA